MEKTLNDFWLMVWLQRANRIVMVTKLIEGGMRVGELLITWYDVTLTGALASLTAMRAHVYWFTSLLNCFC